MVEEEIQVGEGVAEEKAPENTTASEGEPKPENAEEGVEEIKSVDSVAQEVEVKEEEVNPEVKEEQAEMAVAPETEATEVMNNPVNAVQVIDHKGRVVETFTKEKHGEGFIQMAKEFAVNLGHMIGYK